MFVCVLTSMSNDLTEKVMSRITKLWEKHEVY